ncbi:MAG: hypothetical protein CFH01_00331 [Alphaproteobacteria bacterium MarineAlpha2_Bin1]|nr:MAG: hypothetical protein CFH01_00331 [Alphaproteobacteria bacterium MarineAlpha2_Bin1]|tara:strand:+ start:273 stop:530 length:258 start_codon:yes stop_codon:yes gene_type:complete
MESEENKNIHWLVRPPTIRLLWIVMFLILGLVILLQFFAHIHGHFIIDESFGFNAWYGFIACVLMVFVSKLLALFVKRKDNYYDD